MIALWTSQEAVDATGGRSTGNWQASGVSIDTRTLQRGDLFVALKDQRDGHEFVMQAFEKGAAAALVERVPEGVPDDAALLIVPDVLGALTDLAQAARARTKAKVIAVTGSVGKTSTKEMLRSALEKQGAVHAAEMSFNNHWGVPLTLARMPVDTRFAIVEIGMNHPGEIAPLSKITKPHVAVITIVAAAHMAAFGSIEEIATAKAEIFDGFTGDGTAILNRDIGTSELLRNAAKKAKADIIGFGQNAAADFRLLDVIAQPNGSTVKAAIRNHTHIFKLSAPGEHFAVNALAVLAAVEAVGADVAVAALDLTNWQPPQGRGRRSWIVLDTVRTEQRLELIDDAYNANPTSVAAAFQVLSAATPVDGLGRKRAGGRIAMLTDMLELGGEEIQIHRDLATLKSLETFEKIHCAGPLMRHFHEALPTQVQGEWHETAELLALRVHDLLDAGDVVMVKGSKGSRASVVVDAIRKLGHSGQGAKRGTA